MKKQKKHFKIKPIS